MRAASGRTGPVVPEGMRRIWDQQRSGVLEGLETLESAVAAILAGDLDEELRDRGRREAHKLSGSVGTFGFRRASQSARELELALEHAGELVHRELPRLAELVVEIRDELELEPVAAEDEPPSEPPSADDGPTELLIVSADRARARLIVAAAREREVAAGVAGSLAALVSCLPAPRRR